MPKEPSIEQVLRRSLGKAAAEALLDKINRMVAKGAKAAAIEKAVTADLQVQFVKQVVTAVSQVIPANPINVRGIQAKARPVVRGIVARAPDIHRGIQAKAGHRRGQGTKSR